MKKAFQDFDVRVWSGWVFINSMEVSFVYVKDGSSGYVGGFQCNHEEGLEYQNLKAKLISVAQAFLKMQEDD